MESTLNELEPAAVWNSFERLNCVPRPSKKEEKVIRFMLDYGHSLKLETIKDSVGNVIIRKPATRGMEGRKPIVLQAHLDMVHQKNSSTSFDFESQGIEMYIEDDWVKARGTTLGADNGMGVAAIMAILGSDTVAHPSLEALFTVDEETGMTGAMGLKPNILQGKILLNLDTEEDDEIDIGCAGGLDITATGSYKPEKVENEGICYTLQVYGLQGGHSGMDIHKGLGNANKIMNRLLYMAADKHYLRIAEIEGGGLRNAIPRESRAIVVIPAPESDGFENNMIGWSHEIRRELSHTDPSLEIKYLRTTARPAVMDQKSQQHLIKALYAAQNGVYSMSPLMDGLVEASNNIANVIVREGSISIGCLARSSVDTVKTDLANSLTAVFELAGLSVSLSGEYPGWNPDPDSGILEILRSRYKQLFGKEPRVVACHAGLECGILGATYPGLDMISFGPTIRGAHSPDERVQISSVRKFWTLLLDVLQHIPPK